MSIRTNSNLWVGFKKDYLSSKPDSQRILMPNKKPNNWWGRAKCKHHNSQPENQCRQSVCHSWWYCIKQWPNYSTLCWLNSLFALLCSISITFFCSRLEAASGVISGVALDNVGLDVVQTWVILGQTTWVIRAAHFVMDNERRQPTEVIAIGRNATVAFCQKKNYGPNTSDLGVHIVLTSTVTT